MFHQNNSEIDFTALEDRVRHMVASRRHETRLLSAPPPGSPPAGAQRPAGWRARLRALPVLGPWLQRVYQGWRRSLSPGLSWRQRIRAFPGVGQAAVWGHAALTLPWWRRSLRDELTRTRDELAQTRQELHALRRAQGELMRDMAELRASVLAASRSEAGSAPDSGDRP